MSIAEWSDMLPIVTIQRLTEQPDPRGEDYGNTWGPAGAPMPALSEKLDSTQLYRRGKEDVVLRYKLFLDLLPDGSAPLNESTDRVAHAEGGELDVVNVKAWPSEGMCVAEAQRTR